MSDLDDLLMGGGGWSNVNVSSITVPTGASSGQVRMVIGTTIPPCLQNLQRSNVYPADLRPFRIIAAILYYNTDNSFQFMGVSEIGTLINGRADSEAANANVLMYQVEFSGQTYFGGILNNEDFPTGATLQSTSQATQAQYYAINHQYWGADDGVVTVPFSPFQVTHFPAAPYSNQPIVCYVPMGGVPGGNPAAPLGSMGSYGSGLHLTAQTAGISAETVVTSWASDNGASGITTATFPVFRGRAYSFVGNVSVQSSVAGDLAWVMIKQMVGGTPAPATDPCLASLRIPCTIGALSNTNAFQQRYVPGSDQVITCYVTFQRRSGTGNVLLDANGATIFTWWGLEDKGLA